MVTPTKATERPTLEMLIAFQDMCVNYMQNIGVLEGFAEQMTPGQVLITTAVSDYFSENWTFEQFQADYEKAVRDTAEMLGIAPEGDEDESV